MHTWIQRAFAPLKKTLPAPVSDLIRSVVAASVTPFIHYYRLGHTRSAFARKAQDRAGNPLPWYTYPAIEFLSSRDFSSRAVLEFGAGQSTLWWSKKAGSVVSLEGDEQWLNYVRANAPPNTELHLIPNQVGQNCVIDCAEVIAGRSFDIIVIDGLDRGRLIELAASVINSRGAIICDNSEGYGIFEGFRERGFQRTDFFGAIPGVIMSGATSIFFKDDCFLFRSDDWPIVIR